MFSDDRKDGSPRFGKLHFPVGLWINSPKKHFAKLGRRWPSVGSVKSTSSDTASRGSEPVEMRPATKNKASRHKRFSTFFQRSAVGGPTSGGGGRWASEKKLADLIDPLPEGRVEPPSQGEVPGVLKIYGGDISTGTNYKSVLATVRSTARQLVREALERYGIAQPNAQEAYVLCDVVGSVNHSTDGSWRAQYLRAVGDSERPLVLQDVWKPKTGCTRRFEIRRRCDVERMAEDEDEGAGINSQTHRQQSRRLRAASGGHTAPKERADNLSLRRSISDMNLSMKRRRERKGVLSMAVGEPAEGGSAEEPRLKAGEEAEGMSASPASEDAAVDGANLEQLTQCLIQPPTEHPYFLQLLGYNEKQEFVIHVMTRRRHIFGRPERRPAPDQSNYVDTFLSAPDILPRHCCVVSSVPPADPSQPRGSAMVRPFRGAAITHNGAPLHRQVELAPGDLLGMGQHFLFMYKDPRSAAAPPAWLPKAWVSPGLVGALACQACGRSLQERQEAFRAYLKSREPQLRYRPQEQEALLAEIIRLQEVPGCRLGPAFLFGLCLEHAARELEPGQLPRLIARIAQLVKEAVWEKIKEIGDRQPENQQDKGESGNLGVEEVAADLRPLMLWMANSMELLNLVQKRVLDIEKDLDLEGVSHSPLLSSDLETCDEAMVVLDEVIMSTFQQSVYYLTKTLYSALPALLDSNPFTATADLSHVPELSRMPEGIRGTLAIYQATLELTRDCGLHPDLVSQTFGYLFFFSNASLFNTLMERGGSQSLFQWAKAVQIRTNLDLVLDWLQGVGLGDIATEFFRKLSTTANLLCLPKSSLLQTPWSRLRDDYPALSPAQLQHVLRNYQLGPGRVPPECWDPSEKERDEIAHSDIFESFTEHPPLILPCDGFCLRLSEPVSDDSLHRQLVRLRRFLWELERESLPANQRAAYGLDPSQ
ncbi:Ras-interacting protein 1 [Varanus komodoensis]|uniref:ras-interacting protein 1 n=1 Tax=Varanus komodoensis TaxID=61221 RepID=UPI001CF7C069|nr:ras-interacting protein 1 [Varanus komodoensis]XP_044304049.1 ras-interacting protein 1 [Varanus komodoensis]KAF7238828.1 Ras-interacting protein 1 [Varanus komodoensis]